MEVYRTSKGKYKITPDRDPLEFLFCCVATVSYTHLEQEVWDACAQKEDGDEE